MLTLTDEQWFARLNERRAEQAREQAKLWKYYDNDQPLAFIAKILQEQGDRFPPLRFNWSSVVVDSAEERLDVENFRVRGQDANDEDLTRVWQGNDLDELSSEAHLAAMVTGQAFITIGAGLSEGADPIVRIDYGDQVAVEVDPLTGEVVAAIKVWSSDTVSKELDQAVLYLPGRFIEYEFASTAGVAAKRWNAKRETKQDSPIVPVVPMFNKPRRGRGRTELNNILSIVDAVNQTATNMMAALEHHALPRRWAVNVAESDFQDAQGNPVPAWRIATGAIWAIPRAEDDGTGTQPQPSVGQFTGAALDNFHNSVRLLALQAAAQYGIPGHYFGYVTDNPASADSIRAMEARLVKRVERRQRTFGGAWERAMKIVLTMLGRDTERVQLETVWRDAATPTKSAQAQAAMELVNAGIIDREQAREDLGYTQTQRDAISSRATGLDMDSIVQGLRNVSTGSDLPPENLPNPASG